ncbi:hypothetical protein QQ045_019956 [Rhodiola kirilowii]
MLSRIISPSSSPSRFLALIAPSSYFYQQFPSLPSPNFPACNPHRAFSSGKSNNGGCESDFWKISPDEASKTGSILDEDTELMKGLRQTYKVDRIKVEQELESEKQQLTAVLKGPDRAFGDLVATSGITDEMLDILMAFKDFSGIEGLPPLKDIEDWRVWHMEVEVELSLDERDGREDELTEVSVAVTSAGVADEVMVGWDFEELGLM